MSLKGCLEKMKTIYILCSQLQYFEGITPANLKAESHQAVVGVSEGALDTGILHIQISFCISG